MRRFDTIWTFVKDSKVAFVAVVAFLALVFAWATLTNGNAAAERVGAAVAPRVEHAAPVVEPEPAPAPAPVEEPAVEEGRVVARGEASFYGQAFAGRPTASGERFDPSAMTAAHRTLPFGSRVRVENVANGKSVVVTINDRGPYAGDRVLDLSQGAAQKLDMIDRGTADVEIRLLNG